MCDYETPNLSVEQLTAHDLCYERDEKSDLCDCSLCMHRVVCPESGYNDDEIYEEPCL